jgi:hypothetical protein
VNSYLSHARFEDIHIKFVRGLRDFQNKFAKGYCAPRASNFWGAPGPKSNFQKLAQRSATIKRTTHRDAGESI